MGEHEMAAMLGSRQVKGRGAVGSRTDEPGPYLPRGHVTSGGYLTKRLVVTDTAIAFQLVLRTCARFHQAILGIGGTLCIWCTAMDMFGPKMLLPLEVSSECETPRTAP